jgi:hypothetical protein
MPSKPLGSRLKRSRPPLTISSVVPPSLMLSFLKILLSNVWLQGLIAQGEENEIVYPYNIHVLFQSDDGITK